MQGQNWKVSCLSNYIVLTIFLYLIRRVSKFSVLNYRFALSKSCVVKGFKPAYQYWC